MGLSVNGGVVVTVIAVGVCTIARAAHADPTTHENATEVVGAPAASAPAASAPATPPPSATAPATAPRRGPFLAASIGSVLVDHRFVGQGGGGGGVLFVGPLRVAADFLYFSDTADVNLNANIAGLGGTLLSPLPSWLFSASVGYAFQPRTSLAVSPGVRFMTTELAAHGHALVAVVPLDWMWAWGLRLTLEGGLGYAFGGEVRLARCSTGQPCTEVVSRRDDGVVLQLRFGCGFGF